MKSCKCVDCYHLSNDGTYCWHLQELILDGACNSFLEKCPHCKFGTVEYIYQYGGYCRECLFEEFGIEEHPGVMHYYQRDEYLGNDQDDTILEMLQKIDKTIQEVE